MTNVCYNITLRIAYYLLYMLIHIKLSLIDFLIHSNYLIGIKFENGNWFGTMCYNGLKRKHLNPENILF